MTARQSHWRIMFCWQNLTLWYMMLWLRGMHRQTLWQLQNLRVACSWARLFRLCDRLPPVNSPPFVSDLCWYVHQAAAWLWVMTLQLKPLGSSALPLSLPTNWKDREFKYPELPGRLFKAHVHRDWIRLKKSSFSCGECSERLES